MRRAVFNEKYVFSRLDYPRQRGGSPLEKGVLGTEKEEGGTPREHGRGGREVRGTARRRPRSRLKPEAAPSARGAWPATSAASPPRRSPPWDAGAVGPVVTETGAGRLLSKFIPRSQPWQPGCVRWGPFLQLLEFYLDSLLGDSGNLFLHLVMRPLRT